MSTNAELEKLESEVLALERALAEHTRSNRRAATTSMTVGVALLSLVVVFLAVNYSRVSAEMTSEKLTQSFSKELTEVAPVAMNEISKLGKDLLPVFAEQTQKQVEALWPELSQKLEAEIDELGSRILADAHTALSESEHRISALVERSVLECYPSLNDERKREEIARRLHTVCEQALTSTLVSFDNTFSKDVDRLRDTVLRFDITDSDESTTDLHKRFLRLWLKLLDHEVSEL